MRRRVVRGARHVRERGVTLFEVLIVVAILALISAGVALAAIKFLEDARVRHAKTSARAIRGAVKAWWIHHDADGCPGVDELIREGTLDRDSTRVDPWGETWRVECAERDVTVISTGRDRKLGTEDDIRIRRRDTFGPWHGERVDELRLREDGRSVRAAPKALRAFGPRAREGCSTHRDVARARDRRGDG
jgi:prepilin-type N-terminal cleavage/methylation domain-containing protein